MHTIKLKYGVLHNSYKNSRNKEKCFTNYKYKNYLKNIKMYIYAYLCIFMHKKG